MIKPPNAQFSHLGFLVRDLDAMIDFYTRTLGLVLTDRGAYRLGGEIAFLSRNVDEHHQIVLVSGRDDSLHAAVINQISFHVDSLEDLRTFYQLLVGEGVQQLTPRNHGNAWSIYFIDPEQNRIELYTPSPWHVAQPFGKDLDLTRTATEILAETERMVLASPTVMPREAWASSLQTKLHG